MTRIDRLWRYPVKSMAGEALPAADVSWHGVSGDRRWAFVRPDHESRGFPWHTIREQPRMCLFAARVRDGSRADASMVDVRTPDGTELEITDPALPDLLGPGVRLMRLHRGLFDAMPLSLIGTASVVELCRRIGVTADPRRFRPNLLVHTEEPFVEDQWVGSTIRIGGAVVRLDRRDQRCVIVNVDPDSARSAPDMLRALARERHSCVGVYGSVVSPGRVQVGDELCIMGAT